MTDPATLAARLHDTAALAQARHAPPCGELVVPDWLRAECGQAADLILAQAERIAALEAVGTELLECSDYWSEYLVPLGIVGRLRKALGLPTTESER